MSKKKVHMLGHIDVGYDGGADEWYALCERSGIERCEDPTVTDNEKAVTCKLCLKILQEQS